MKQTQGERLLYILSELKITPYRLSKELGYRSPDSVYRVLNNEKQVSQRFIMALGHRYGINSRWLLYGEGNAFNYKITKGFYGNEFSYNGKLIYPARLKFYKIREIAEAFAKVIFGDSDTEDYNVETKVVLIDGLEFRYTTFTIENERVFYDKYYSVIILPDWSLGAFFDFWRIEGENRRCQNLFELLPERRQDFIDVLFPILHEIEVCSVLADDDDILFKNNEYIKIYSTNTQKVKQLKDID